MNKTKHFTAGESNDQPNGRASSGPVVAAGKQHVEPAVANQPAVPADGRLEVCFVHFVLFKHILCTISWFIKQ